MLFKKFNFIQRSVLVMVYLLFLQIDINTPILAQEPDLVEPENENFLGINLTLLIGIITASSAIIAAAVTSYFTKKSNMELNIRNDLRKKE